MQKIFVIVLMFCSSIETRVYLNALNTILPVAPADSSTDFEELNSDHYFGDYSWYTKNLTWCLLPTNLQDINLDDLESLITESFKVWNVENLNFIRINSFDLAHIKISLEQFNHGDWSPFTNKTQRHIHAFGPMHRNLPGSIHINFRNKWIKDKFLNELIFNIGVTLGMMANKNPSSVMYYRNTSTKQLIDFDLENINRLFSNPKSPYINSENFFNPKLNGDVVYTSRVLDFFVPIKHNNTKDVYLDSPVFIINF